MREGDSDETEGRNLYRARADKLAYSQVSIARRKVRYISMDPATLQEHSQRAGANNYVKDGVVHLCCPFCAGPDFITYDQSLDALIGESIAILQREATCKECQRSGKLVIDPGPQMVQTGGSDPPPYLHIRRES